MDFALVTFKRIASFERQLALFTEEERVLLLLQTINCSSKFTQIPPTLIKTYSSFYSQVDLFEMNFHSVWVDMRVFTICASLLDVRMLHSLVMTHCLKFCSFELTSVTLLNHNIL